MKKWTLTDPATKQYGRQLSETCFEFKEKGMDQRIIDLKNFTEETIEHEIDTFGYTLYEAKSGAINIVEQYGEEANWIIAECLFESNVKEDKIIKKNWEINENIMDYMEQNAHGVYLILKSALADLEGVMPQYEPSGERKHSGWKTIKEIKVVIKKIEE